MASCRASPCELVNESTGHPRGGHQRSGRVQLRGGAARHLHASRRSLTGFKTYENAGVRIGAQQFITLDIALEVGQLQETITVTGQAPLIDTSNASTGARHRRAAAADAAERRPIGLPVRGDVPTVVASGDVAVQPPAGSDQRLAAVAGRRHAPRQQLPGRRRADHRHAQPRLGQSRRSRRSKKSTCSCTPTTPKRGAPAAARSTSPPSRAPTTGTAAASIRTVRNGARRTTSSPSSPGSPSRTRTFHLGGGGFGGPIIRNRTFFWARVRGLRIEHDARRRAAVPDQP